MSRCEHSWRDPELSATRDSLQEQYSCRCGATRTLTFPVPGSGATERIDPPVPTESTE